ncbi:MAG TPA: UDP-N-acetylmuramate dehydrogenase [Nitrospirota bacterium]|nr:UDP-N-acetylmuramate dehydrogenase [Nitrospirota bacterium]
MDIKNLRGEIKKNEPLCFHTSFGIGGPADMLIYPADRTELIVVLKEIRKRGMPYFALGSGTNVLVRDGGFRGVVICLKHLTGVEVEREYRSVGGAFTVVRAEAGASLAKVLAFTMDKGLTGLEFAAGIPGTVGGAICMNAGTSSGEIGDIVETVSLLSPDGTIVTRGREELGFGYRTCMIPEHHLVLETKLVLRREDKNRIQGRIKDLMEKRSLFQPQGLPNAGSMFKNPHEESAGRLIESVGLKGKSVGDAQVSEKHANFIVNRGKATASDVLKLMEIVKKTVLEMRGIRLEPEIKIIGED